MRYTLKDYQDEAVGDVLRLLARARADWDQWQSHVAFSLTATTGAGKTVMAAAVIEALFDGNADYDFESDPGAVVLWFTDDPSLNEQTRFRLLDAADRISHSRLVVIENTFNQEKLESGQVYFLNAQKLGKKSLLVRGPQNPPDSAMQSLPMPDMRVYTMWDTLANTIDDKNLTLYLILDEAHRGMKPPSTGDQDEKATIVQRLVNGANGVPPVPIVWGISATVERFNDAMVKAENRTSYPSVVVAPGRVQESGLLKDDIRLDFPAETGQFDTVLLSRATSKVQRVTELWRDYALQECDSEKAVVPLLVVQMPNKPSDDVLSTAITTIHKNWPELTPDAMAHVFGDHAPIKLGGFTVPHIAPEKVQDHTHIRVLFAKDAISTGWDCPRAEVMVSFRPARDETHITQLLGRMVRTPLARRVPGNDLLNSVECVLPHFDRSTAAKVAERMLGDREHDGDGTGGGDGRRVLLAPVDMRVNQSIPETVWEAFDKLPSQTLPRRGARPIRRLMQLAQALSRDGLMANARKAAYKRLFARLDGLLAQHNEPVAVASQGILEVEGETIVAPVVGGEVRDVEKFIEAADEQSVEADFKAAGRALTADLARKYGDYLEDSTKNDDGLFEAHVKIAALAQIDGVSDELDREADMLATKWFSKYRVAIKELSQDRVAVYDEIKGRSRHPHEIEIKRPYVRAEETKDSEGNKLETRMGHLMSDGEGEFPVGLLNRWEIQVLDEEIGRSGFRAWYRNPQRPSGDALAIPYQNSQGHWRRMFPDFVFFHGDDKDIKISIVDPHGHHLADAIPKLRGLTKFAIKYGEAFHRIESVAQMKNGALRVLDLTKLQIQETVLEATDIDALYSGDKATDY